jgi:hypothetical protein
LEEKLNFKDEHPNYESYRSSERYEVKKIPDELCYAIQGLILRICETDGQLRKICDNIATRIPCESTKNWGWDFLKNDIADFVLKLKKKKFHKFMDFLSYLYIENKRKIDLHEFNDDILGDNRLGYSLRTDGTWELTTNIEDRTSVVVEVQKVVKDICLQTMEYLEQSSEHLRNTLNERDRKDAVRDSLSALESLLKKLTQCKDIKEATDKLKSDSSWGPKEICKEGLTIWKQIHHLYPDVRHGNPIKSQMTDEEALYWVGKMMNFLKYLSSKKKLFNLSIYQ